MNFLKVQLDHEETFINLSNVLYVTKTYNQDSVLFVMKDNVRLIINRIGVDYDTLCVRLTAFKS